MGLILPDVSVTAGPLWATLLNNAFTSIDSHDHSTGKGIKVTPSGLNINSDLSFVQNNATNMRTARLFNNSTFTPGVNDLTALYSLNDELYYRDGAGNTIQITLGGFLDVSGSISSLTIKDTSFFIENFSDNTKQFRFNVSAIPTGTTRILSVPDSGANDSFVTNNGTATLSNKTLTGNIAANLSSSAGSFVLNTSGTVTVPNAIDTLVGKATSDVLTNKTLSGNIATNLISGAATVTLPTTTGTLATLANAETFSNKSFTGPVTVLADTTIRFNESTNNFYTSLQAGTNVANYAIKLPIADGTTGQVIKTDGSGNWSFTNVTVTTTRSDVATATTISALSSSSNLIRLTGSTVTTVQGIVAGTAGQILTVANKSTALVTFANQNGSATAANRIAIPASFNLILYPNFSLVLQYDDSQARWIPISQIDAQLVIGNQTGTAPVAGFIGEEIRSTVSTTNAAATTIYQDLTSITLSPGVWDITVSTVTDANGATITGAIIIGASTTSGNSGAGLTLTLNNVRYPGPTATGPASIGFGSVPAYRVVLSSSTTYYLKTQATYSAGTPQHYGTIKAVRVG